MIKQQQQQQQQGVKADVVLSSLGLTAAQEAVLKQLRSKCVGAVMDESRGKKWLNETGDETYVRFLKGDGWRVDVAHKHITATADWRYRNSVNTIVEVWDTDTSKAVMLTHGHWPVSVCGPDHLGRPVQMVHLTGVDFPGLTREVGLDVMMRYVIYLLEKTVRGNPSGEGVVIIDLGLDSLWAGTLVEIRTWVSAVMKFFRKVSKIAEKHFPEAFCKIFFTRVPKTFMTTFHLTRPFISASTLAKIQILSDTPLEALLKYMPIDTVPAMFGGKSEELTGLGGKIPKGALLDEEYMTQITTHVRTLRGEVPFSRESLRFSMRRTPEEEREIQEHIALEMIKHQVCDMKHQSAESHQRGSWSFVPGLDWLANADDATILAQLQQDKLNPDQALEHLKQIAIEQEEAALKTDTENVSSKTRRASPASLISSEGDDTESTADGGNCSIM